MKKIWKKTWAALLLTLVLLGSGFGGSSLNTVSAAEAAIYQGIDYSAVFDAAYYATANPDIAALYGNDEAALLEHFATVGMKEGRVGCADFDITAYVKYNQDLVPILGTSDISYYYLHYIYYGKAEGRIASENAAATSTTATTAVASAAQSVSTREQEVYNAIIAQKANFPEGLTWTNDNYYAWKGGIYSGGYGCAGFAFLMSDVAFGDAPAQMHTDVSNIRVGDILRMNGNTHSVIVLEVHDDSIVVAEGNYNSSIHWGRKISTKSLASDVDYVMTRY